MPASRFVAFHDLPEAHAPAALVPTFALMLARGPAGVVLVFNRYRRVWELPGGLIDAGESARDSASRELAEEAGCIADAVEWLGLVEVEGGGHRCGAVFTCAVASVPAQMRNEEVDGIAAWAPGSAPEPLGATDRALLERWARTGPRKTA